MPRARPETLTFERLDQLSIARFAGIDDDRSAEFLGTQLGPYFEWVWLRKSGHRLCHLKLSSTLDRLRLSLKQGLTTWTDSSSPCAGFIRVQRKQADLDNLSWIAFCYAFERAAHSAGLSTDRAKQLTGALGELEDNIHEHSEAAHTGIVAYCAHSDAFEFVVLDLGVGVLQSLRRCSAYAAIADHGRALQIAITNGNSRFGTDSGHGYGFHDLCIGIANTRSRLRFRSGDHLYEMDGTADGSPRAQVAQRASGKGFLVSTQWKEGRAAFSAN